MPMRKHNQRSSYIFTLKNTSSILCSGGSKECRFPTFLNLNIIFKRATTTDSPLKSREQEKTATVPTSDGAFLNERYDKELVLLWISSFALEV